MRFTEAIGVAFITGSNRKPVEGAVDRAGEISWAQAITGIIILVLVQAGLLVWSSSGLGAEVQRDLAIVAYVALAAPFVLFAIAAALVNQQERLPGAFLYLSLILAGLQLLSAIVSYMGTGASGFLIGILAAIGYLGARGFLRLGVGPAILMAILVVAAFIGAGMLLFALPAGQLLR